MLINRSLIERSERRMQFKPADVLKNLADGQRELSEREKATRYKQLLAQTGDAERARAALERIIAGNDLDSINYLSKGLSVARSVCRIQLRDSQGNVQGFGTGFLIGPGVLMTNNHVFETPNTARNSLADFDYEVTANGRDKTPVFFGFDPNALFFTNQALDFTIIAIKSRSLDNARNLTDYGWLPLSATPGKADPGDYLTIIQHPAGERKQICVRENKLLKYDGNAAWYTTDTLGGSSGSPVFNRFWQVVALHHSGVPRKNSKGQWLTKDGKVWDQSMDESRIHWIANEGIRISAIVNFIKTATGSHPLVKAALTTAPPPAPESAVSGGVELKSQANVWVEQTGATATLVVPMRIPIDVVRHDPDPAPAATAALVIADSDPDAGVVEAVKINQKTLGTRPGYKADFLGKGKLSVPLPVIPAALKSKVATFIKKPSEFELRYFNYSAVIRKDRQLAFFSAVNIDGKLRQDVGKREGDSWLRDPRIKGEFQLGEEFYGKQKTFEADRSQNPFDRGHLVRRLDATWGNTVAAAKEHGDDTFHFTNCSPQFWQFNQGKKLWAGIEDFVLDHLEEAKRKACVFNGPVFDGPLAPKGGLPDPKKAGKADPKFGDIAIPKFFWKIMVVEQDGELAATAFLLSQQDQLSKIDRIEEAMTEEDTKVFQVSIADLAKLTKLDFGSIAKADTKEAATAGGRLIEVIEDIRL